MELSYKLWHNKCNKFIVIIAIVLLFCIAYLIYNQPMVEGLSETQKDIKRLKYKSNAIYRNSKEITKNQRDIININDELSMIKELVQDNSSSISELKK
jgi:type II secretory pathway component PulM